MKKLLLLVLCMMSFSVVGQAEEEGKLIGYFLESDTKEKTELSVLMKQCTSDHLIDDPEKNAKDCIKEMGLDPEIYTQGFSQTIPVKRVRKKGFFSGKIIDDYELYFELISREYIHHTYKFRPRSPETKSLEQK